MNWQDALRAVAPRVDMGKWQEPLEQAFRVFRVNTDRRVAAALGQFLQEAGTGFQFTVENLNYSSVARLQAVYPRVFSGADGSPSPDAFTNDPEKLANLVYANRNGNGGYTSGDGYLFRGRGLIQITGRAAYTAFAAASGVALDACPAWCETPTGAAMSGCWFLESNGCLPLADEWEISEITRKVNGPAMLGAEDRLWYSNRVLSLLQQD